MEINFPDDSASEITMRRIKSVYIIHFKFLLSKWILFFILKFFNFRFEWDSKIPDIHLLDSIDSCL